MKDKVLDAIKRGKVSVLSADGELDVLKVLEKIQPATLREIIAEVGSRGRVRPRIRTLRRLGKISAVFYEGKVYYVTKKYLEKIRQKPLLFQGEG